MTLSIPAGNAFGPSEVPVASESSAYAIKLSVFEGPLDLLLHLIRQNEVEITDIPIAEISEQYLSYLDAMRELNLDVVGEYLLLAATLAWIKSRMLLPPETSPEDGREIDPRAELVARLLEYQRFKEVALGLGDRHLLGRDVFDARTSDFAPAPEGEREIEVGLFDLVQAFNDVLANVSATQTIHEVETEPITVRERMLVVMRRLETHDALEFTQLFGESLGEAASRPVIIATFLAILELTRLTVIRLYQSLNEDALPDGPIHVRRALAPGDPSWQHLISESM
ncbi:MAG: segregation and condensation protein A [Myxococcota bacterium]